MYHYLAMDQIRIQQEELHRRAAAASWSRQPVENRSHRPRRQWWPRPARSLLRLAFTDTAMRPMPPACVDC